MSIRLERILYLLAAAVSAVAPWFLNAGLTGVLLALVNLAMALAVKGP